MEDVVIIFAVVILCYSIWKYLKYPKNLPPRPTGIPVLGYLPFLGRQQHLTFSKLRARYGDIFSLYVGQKLFVVLSSFELVKEVFVRQRNNFNGRPTMVSAIPPEFSDAKGIALNEGRSWSSHRETTLTFMKTCLRSNGNAESIIQNEIQHFLQEIAKLEEKPTNFHELMNHIAVNVNWTILFGKRKGYSDEKLNEMVRASQEHTRAMKFAAIEIAFPRIFNIPYIGQLFLTSVAVEKYRYMYKYIDNEISLTKISPNGKDELSFIQSWFKLYPEESEDYAYYRRQLPPILIDLHMAGTDILASTLQWALLYMAECPQIQQKVQNEIDEIIGRTNKPSFAHKNNMPYTEATLMEIHRIVSIGPLAVPHVNSVTTTINGYTIPKNTIVLSHLWEIHHDPKIFLNPHQFQPDRFLENGQLKKVEECIPFSIGNRQCAGESLARVELFLIFTSLLQRYTFKKPQGEQLDLSINFGLLIEPKPQKICATNRG